MKALYEVRLTICINVEAEDEKDAEKVAWSKVTIADENQDYCATSVDGVEFIQNLGETET